MHKGTLYDLRREGRNSCLSSLFHSNIQTNALAVEPRLTNCCNSAVGCLMNSSFGCKGSVPGEGLPSLILLECQMCSDLHVALYQLRFLCKDSWCYFLGTSYPFGFCGINSTAHRSLSVKMALASHEQCSVWSYLCVAQSRSVCKGFSVARGCASRPGQVVIPACNPCKTNCLASCESVQVVCVCTFGWSRAKQSGPYCWFY